MAIGIPAELREAFHIAIGVIADWHLGGELPPVIYRGRPMEITTICEGAGSFDDEMPDEIYCALCTLAGDPLSGPKDRSYRSGARCLREIYDYRKARFERKQ